MNRQKTTTCCNTTYLSRNMLKFIKILGIHISSKTPRGATGKIKKKISKLSELVSFLKNKLSHAQRFTKILEICLISLEKNIY